MMRRYGFMTGVVVQMAVLCGAEMVPFAIPLEMASSSPLLRTAEPLSEADRLEASEHFVTSDGRRVRLWGVNLSFAACFPTHSDAEKVARRLAGFGVNSVRFHHMDTASWPRGLWTEDGRGLHAEALDRLDYFVDQLARHGIYTNLNLHVGRVHSRELGLPQADEDYDKMVSLFTPALIEAQKEFARHLLTRENPYRQMTYAEDYAVAIVEITNENSLFMWSADRVLPSLPTVYAEILRGRFNEWLQGRYDSEEALAAAWTKGSTPLGDAMLRNADFSDVQADQAAPTGWTLEQHAGCRATLSRGEFNGRAAMVVTPEHISDTDWHLQVNQGQLSVQAGQVYTVRMEVAAEQACRVALSVAQGHTPWSNLGLWQSIELTPQWQTLTLTFTATETNDNARLSVLFGGCQTPFAMASMGMRPGVEYALEPGESLEDETVKVFASVESEQRKIDRMVFLAETEKAYFDQMYRFIKTDLNYRGMVTGTIVFGPLGLYAQSDMDFIDSHAYWQHPRFPRRAWDPGDWLIDQKAMSDRPDEATLFRLAAERLQGKPFTVTEYNHPAPLDSQAECVPMIASFAAAQDWDGLWLYTYSHSGDAWDRRHLSSYFDIDSNPSKWGFMPAGTTIYRQGALLPRRYSAVYAMTQTGQPLLDTLAQLHLKHGSNLFASLETPWQESLTHVLFRTLQGDKPVSQQRYNPTEPPAATVHNWQAGYAMKNDTCWILTGDIRAIQKKMPSDDVFRFQIESPSFAAITMTTMDGKPLNQDSTRMLITACGRCENTGMQFSEDRRTVGRNWGQAPVQIEPVVGTIRVHASSAFSGPGVTCHVLNPDGSVRKSVPVVDGRIRLTAEDQTLWYVIERDPDAMPD